LSASLGRRLAAISADQRRLGHLQACGQAVSASGRLQSVGAQIGQVCLEEGKHALAVSVARHLQGLVMLGAFDEPEILWLPGSGKEGLGHLGLDIRIGSAVNH